MSPLVGRKIATVGSGVMAEAIIAGLLRGRLVEPDQIVASHPRAERREELAAAHGIRVVAGNAEAVHDADIVILALKPQMLARVGREIAPALRDGQLVLSIIAGATTRALAGILGLRQVVRSMPNTPAQLGRGMTVWYATPDTTDEQRAQARTLLSALGSQLEVDDEKLVAMATAVSGTGPTYVFLVMEALIDAAVHLGFPRHIAHDLVIETLEGSTLLREAVRGRTRPSCGTWSPRPAAPVPPRSTSSSRGACGRSSRRRSGRPSGGPSSWASSSRRPSTTRRRADSAAVTGPLERVLCGLGPVL